MSDDFDGWGSFEVNDDDTDDLFGDMDVGGEAPTPESTVNDFWGSDAQGGTTSEASQMDTEDGFGWGDTVSSAGTQTPASASQDDSWNDEVFPDQVEDEPQERNAPQIPMKVVGIIVAVLFIAVALIFMVFDSIKVKPKTDAPQSSTQQAESSQQSSSIGVDTDTLSMIMIPESTVMNYSGDIYTADGKVTNRLKYVQDHQVIYCIEITLVLGSTSQKVNFFCNYATYQAVDVGDVVVVKYQQVSDNYISVNEVTK